MNEATKDFYESNGIKAGVAKSSHYKGGRMISKINDYTEKQCVKKNGDTISYSLNAPMSWEVFNSISPILQKQYVENISKTYNVPIEELSKMFGTTVSNLREKLMACEIKTYFIGGPFKKEEWSEFLKKDTFPKEPMTWTEFKSLGINQQKDYIEWIISKYMIDSCSPFEKMFGASNFTVCNYFKEKFGIKFKRGGYRYGTEKIKRERAFYDWISNAKSIEEVEESPDLEETITIDEVENRKISWKEFKKLDLDQQRSYINWLLSEFKCANGVTISKIFGVDRTVVPKYSREILGITFRKRDGDITGDDIDKWENFVKNDKNLERDEIVKTALKYMKETNLCACKPIEDSESTNPSVSITETTLPGKSEDRADIDNKVLERCAPQNVELIYSGNLNINSIFESIASVIGNEPHGKLTIRFTKYSNSYKIEHA